MTKQDNNNSNVKREHFVQNALIANWKKDGVVGVGRLADNRFVDEHPKPPSSVFFQDYIYELVYHFKSAKIHRQNGLAVNTDSNHVFRYNDVEKYCKKIEDNGLPVIKKLS